MNIIRSMDQTKDKQEMLSFEDLPNELILLIFSYFNRSELFQSFLQLNERFTSLLVEHFHHLHLSKTFTQEDFQRLMIEYFPVMKDYISSLTIDHPCIGKEFLRRIESVPLNHFVSVHLIDEAIDFHEEFLQRFQPDRVQITSTSFYPTKNPIRLQSTSIKQIQLDLQIEHSIDNCLLTQLDLSCTSILVDLRLSCSRISLYFQLFSEPLALRIEKLSLSILSIDQMDFSTLSKIHFPHLNDFQLETCAIPFQFVNLLLPTTKTQQLKRFAFTGQTTDNKAQSWKTLLDQYQSIERIHLQFFHSDPLHRDELVEWELEFPKCFFELDRKKHCLRIFSSVFHQLDRLCVNESVEDFNQIDYPQKISHLTVRSQYWCSSFDLSSKIFNDLITRFDHLRRLSINYQQLKCFRQKNFLSRIEQLDLEFSERYCVIDADIAKEFLRLKSLEISWIYEGSHSVDLHSTIKTMLLDKFPQLSFISIDSIEIIDEDNVERSMSEWFSFRKPLPTISYLKGKLLSVWF